MERDFGPIWPFNIGVVSFFVAAIEICLEDEEGRGRPLAIDDNQLRTITEADSRKTTPGVTEKLNVHDSTVVRHLHQIGKSKKLDKWVPHELNGYQKNGRYEICSALLLCKKLNLFLDHIIPCDNRRRSAQWLDQDEALKHFPKPKLHQKKVMVTVWWSASGVIHYDFLCPSETITAEKYCYEIDKMLQ
uniref:Histone-lysine N-methyltransferase SETMAR n=1 Tax=Heterorhabditis bacteriophora TaxID=37862 RepID=A0A1I7XCJ3_HETBA